jgi:glyoxylase-like metal-dependent hydrolase (beta-lactamase superfamily II)
VTAINDYLMRIIPISLPTPFYIGPVNVYLIAEDPLTLIDTGPKTKEAIDALREGLRRERLRVSDIRRIVLTHAHEDHCGLARSLRDEAKDAEVLVHNWETGHRVGRLEDGMHRNLLARAGVPDSEIEAMRKMYQGVRRYADSFEEHEYAELVDDAELKFTNGALRIVHTPGHTPGSCSFVREADRTVIAGDCVLKRITPNPVLSPDPIDPAKRFPSLAEYLVSLARLRTFAPTLVHGGHGGSVNDFEELFNRYLRAIRERQAEVIRLVSRAGVSAWDISRALFPDTDDVHRFLAVSEAVAHLDLAHSEGKIAVEIGGDREIYRPLTS